jgi:cytochrome c oxidase cbb3-type subunit I/II
LELAGRDVYIKEGCYVCHSQMIRKMSSDVLRYGYGGGASTISESMYDHPFQWGSKRTGPDLAHEGMKPLDSNWHYQHLINPRVTEGSLMPSYDFLATKNADLLSLRKKLSALRALGVPYSDEEVANADGNALKEAKVIADELAAKGSPAGLEKTEIVALIAYIKSLGTKGAQ